MAARLFVLAGAYTCGVLATDVARARASVAVTLAVAGLLWAGVRRSVASLLIAGALCGFARADLLLERIDAAALAAGARGGAHATVQGRVVGDPRASPRSVRFVVAVQHAVVGDADLVVRERAVVTVSPPVHVPSGVMVRVNGRLAPLADSDDDEVLRASAKRWRDQGVAARMFAAPDGVEVLGPSRAVLDRVAETGRAAVRRAASVLPERERGLLLGITIGDVSMLDAAVAEEFRITGLAHLVAVSGANVALVLGVVALVLRAFGAGRRTTVAIMAAAVVAFMAVARFEPSVLRAGVMALIALAGLLLGARRHAEVALAAATMILLVADPFLVRSAAFALSVCATGGILWIAPRIATRLPRGPLATAAAVTLGAQIAVAPLIAALFGQLSLIAIAANLVAAPMVGPATVVGFVAALAGMVWAPLSGLAIAAYLPLAWMLWCAHVLSALPLASIATPRGIGGIGLMLGAAATFVMGRRYVAGRPRVVSLVLTMALLAAAGTWARALSPPPLAGLVVTMLDVGQGDALLVRADGRTMLIDGGLDEGRLSSLLAAHRIRRIDLLVMTHPHADHIDGLLGVARALPIGRVLDPQIDAPLPSYAAVIDALARRGVPRDRAVAGLAYRLGRARVDVLWPPEEHLEHTPSDVNNNSVVLRVAYGARSVLFAGETQEEAQDALLQTARGALAADVLKVAHHGSARMLPAFYDATGARVALIPVGRNTFGHPAASTLLALRGMHILRSDRHGEVSVGLDPAGANVTIRKQR